MTSRSSADHDPGATGFGEVERVSHARLLLRGLVKHCPNCGSGHLFTRWFRMKPRCPRCGLLFEREEGFFLGAFVINFAIAEAAVGVFLILQIAQRGLGGEQSWLPLVGAVVAAVLAPLAFYPFSKTVWCAFDIIMTPLEPGEARFTASPSGGRKRRGPPPRPDAT